MCGGASGDGNAAPLECYGAGVDDTRAVGLICCDDVAGRALDRALGGRVCLRLLSMPSRYRPARMLWYLDDAHWTEVWDDRSETDFECLFNVGQQVLRILDASGVAHQD